MAPNPTDSSVGGVLPPWGGLRAIDFLRKTHGGTWSYAPKAHAPYLHHESGRRVYRAISLHDDVVRLYWEDSGKRADLL